VRSEYDAGSSYAAARNVSVSGYSSYNSGGYGAFGYPFGGFYGPGWYWNSGWNSWAWLPGDGYFYSPFGWGFYSPSYIGYAPIVYVPVAGRQTAVPVSTRNPPALTSGPVRSPAALQAARSQTARTLVSSGPRSAASSGQAPSQSPGFSSPRGGFSAPSPAARSVPSRR
jgi:hypothetical protein